ncbi:hypothetical protein QDX25_08385 [Auritidibacter ignavus]|uniref:hypothetical protein n=1 Tax=Auritidibacter TaxID=1160973 RepID=UPI000D7252D1|nr:MULTISPECIES: hypothetical protein [Auritidibacter]PXA79129.1 hypothetical protein DCC25_09915 [Auritidibacter sp. NML120636]WGH80811.1 hypothetical protein QDX25_08385 [Auritidibacter ignavus]WGH85865.1 hypothetical protein QDX24_09860 [Auritidibacter ignavus]WGH88152.1 hypothetical protein QDX22_09865 [Auritidibacter ignavus]
MTATLPPARYRRGAVWVLVAVMTLFTVVLSACGVSVESQLEYRQDGSGQRILQVEIPDEVFDETDPNQRQVIEDSIETHRPDPLIFDGIAHNPGTSAVAEFRLDFASLDDYQGQVNQLLHASDYAGSTEIEAEISHGTLTDTWDINEPFTVADLLGWLPAGLEADGVVTGSQRQQLADGLQNGATNELVIDGEQYASEDDQRLQVSGEESFGYDRVEVDLTVTESGPIVGEIRLHGGSGGETGDQRRAEFLDQAPERLAMDGVSDVHLEHGHDQLRFTAADLSTAGELVAEFVGNAELGLQVSDQAVDDNHSEFTVTGQNIQCGSTCQASENAVTFSLRLPADYRLQSDTSTSASSTELSGDFSQVYLRERIVESLHVETSLGMTGSVDQRYELTLVEDPSDSGVQHLKDALEAVALDEEHRDGQTLLSFSLAGSDAAQLSERLEEIAPGAHLSRQNDAGLIWPNYTLRADLCPLLGSIPAGVEQPVTHTVRLPWMHRSVTVDDQGSEQGAEIELTGDQALTFTAGLTGPTVLGATLLVVIAVLVLVAVILPLIITTIRSRRARRAAETRPMVDPGPPLMATANTTGPTNAGITTPLVQRPYPDEQYPDTSLPDPARLEQFDDEKGDDRG